MLEDRPRVLHASLLPHISRGIASQLLLEKKAARDLGIPWETELFSPRSSLEPFPEPLNAGPPGLVEARGDSVRERLFTSLKLRRAFYAWLADRESGKAFRSSRLKVQSAVIWRVMFPAP